MSLREWVSEQSTPVKLLLGVAVVVGVVVVLAGAVLGTAVVGTFLTDTGDEVSNTTPMASFSADHAEQGLTLTHANGDAIEAAKLLVVVDGSEESWASRASGDGTVERGDSITVDAADGTTVKLVYDGADSRTTLAQFQA